MATSHTYPLLPYSQLVFDMQKSTPDVYRSDVVVRLRRDEVDIVRLKHAIETAIINHPAFLMQIDAEGYQRFEPQVDVMHGQYHSIEMTDNGSFVDIRFKGNRILGDAISDGILIEDIVRAYNGLSLQKDYYLDYLEHIEELKKSSRYAANQKWLEETFGKIACPVHPNPDVPIDAVAHQIEGLLLADYSDLRDALARLYKEHLLSLTAFFSLASALAIMEYNNTDEAALTWAYEGRETKEEQRIYGSLHRDVPFKIKRSNNKTELFKSARNQIRSGIAHSSYPFTLTYPHTMIWNYALNVLVQPTAHAKMKDIPFPFELIDADDTRHPAYSLLDVEILEGEHLYINYRYSATHYKPESIQRFAALVRKYAEWLLESEN